MEEEAPDDDQLPTIPAPRTYLGVGPEAELLQRAALAAMNKQPALETWTGESPPSPAVVPASGSWVAPSQPPAGGAVTQAPWVAPSEPPPATAWTTASAPPPALVPVQGSWTAPSQPPPAAVPVQGSWTAPSQPPPAWTPPLPVEGPLTAPLGSPRATSGVSPYQAAPPPEQAAVPPPAPILSISGPSMPGLSMPGAERPSPPAAEVRPGGYTTVLPLVVREGSSVRLKPRTQPRFELRTVLERGGPTEIALAVDRDIGRLVTIRSLLPELGGDAAVARFVYDVRVLGKLDHPSVPPLHEVGVRPDGGLYFTAKHVRGEPLGAILERLAAGRRETHRLFPWARRLSIFQGIVQALGFAHEKGLLHGDVNPSNVIVGAFGEVWLTGWGSARPLGAHVGLSGPDSVGNERVPVPAAAIPIGASPYRSPEQLRGEPESLDGRSDLFSAFALLHELLTLSPYGGTGQDPSALGSSAEMRSPAGLYSGLWVQPRQPPVPMELRHLVRRGLQPDPARRFRSAEEVLDEVSRLLSGKVRVRCPLTLCKRCQHEIMGVLERVPLTIGSLTLLTLLVLAAYFALG